MMPAAWSAAARAMVGTSSQTRTSARPNTRAEGRDTVFSMPGADADRLVAVRAVTRPQASHHAAAWDVVRRHLPVTPVVRAPQLGQNVSLKVETFQPTGSFKVRGGLAAVAATLHDDPGREVVGASAGNHGLGLAYAGAKLHAEVTVIVPRLASAAKVSALQQFDVRLVLHGEGYSEAEAHALDLVAREGGRYVSPYNDPDVIAGQATMARELLDQVPNLGTVVVPVGGGGLVSGLSLGLRGHRRPRRRRRVGGLAVNERSGRRRHHRAHHGGAHVGRRPGGQSRGRCRSRSGSSWTTTSTF